MFWYSIWHLFLHSFWHLFWHSTWHSVWHSFLAFYLASILTSFCHLFWHFFLALFCHSIWHSILPFYLTFHSGSLSGTSCGILSDMGTPGAQPRAHISVGSNQLGSVVPTKTPEAREAGLAVFTEKWIAVHLRQCPLLLRSGSAHWDF